jgi:hypothetical protein
MVSLGAVTGCGEGLRFWPVPPNPKIVTLHLRYCLKGDSTELGCWANQRQCQQWTISLIDWEVSTNLSDNCRLLRPIHHLCLKTQQH